MATPNRRPNDSGHKSLLANAWETRRAARKSKKDFWDKADIVAKGVIGLFTALVAIVVAVIGWKLQESIATQSTGKDYLSIALGILEQKDLPEDMKENEGLRKWAVNLLQSYSKVKLDQATAEELAKGKKSLPRVASQPMADNPSLAPLRNLGFLGSNQTAYADEIEGGRPVAVEKFELIRWAVRLYKSGNCYIFDTIGTPLTAFQTGIANPNNVTISPQEDYLVVYDNKRFSVCHLLHLDQPPHTIIESAGGIKLITFSANYEITVTDPTDSQTKYDLLGNEIQ